MKCPRCGEHEAIIDRTYGVLPCEKCQENDAKYKLKEEPEFTTISKSNRITRERDVHAKDIIQPFESKGRINRDFTKAYPERATDYFDKSDLEKL